MFIKKLLKCIQKIERECHDGNVFLKVVDPRKSDLKQK